ncbi:MAG: SDR family oxidoreductase [Candidatus Hydrogenedentota bacterium]
MTGASRGLGLTFARGLAAAGAHVILNATNAALLEERQREFEARGISCTAQAFDITDVRAVQDAVTAIESKVGPIHGLVNNAGIQRRGALETVGEEDWQSVLDVNLTAAWRMAKTVAKGMLNRGQGKIVNIASLTSFGSRPSIGPYTAAKSGIAGLTRSMAVEWGPHGLQCNAIAPGYFATDMTQPLRNDPKFDAWVKLRTPAGRWGKPQELIGPAVFLCSEASSFVNGQILYVDGGWTANL